MRILRLSDISTVRAVWTRRRYIVRSRSGVSPKWAAERVKKKKKKRARSRNGRKRDPEGKKLGAASKRPRRGLHLWGELRTNDRVSMRGFSVVKKKKRETEKREKKRLSFPKSGYAHHVKTNWKEKERESDRGGKEWKGRRERNGKWARRRIVLATSGIVKYDRLLVKWDQNIGCRELHRTPSPSPSSLSLSLSLCSLHFNMTNAQFCSCHVNYVKCPWNEHFVSFIRYYTRKTIVPLRSPIGIEVAVIALIISVLYTTFANLE